MDQPLLLLLCCLVTLGLGVIAGLALGSRLRAGERTALRARLDAAEGATQALRELAARERADASARTERERADASVLQALAPVSHTLERMRAQLGELERDRVEQYGQLAAQLRLSREADEQLRRTTESLAGALRSGTTRGVWGETALRRIVEAAGLTRHVDFVTQASIASDAGAGRPDMIVRLPGDAAVPIDAKVPLDAYLEASALPASEDERRAELLQRHVKAVRAHVDALAKKAYWAGIDGAPEFVICFLPNEGLLATALDHDPTLLDYAFSRRVALASPVNLWSVLKTISFAWTQQDVSAEARTLFELGNTLYKRLGDLAGHAEQLGRSLGRSVEHYNRFVASLETRVLVTARKFPGIDESALIAAPGAVSDEARPLTAPEFAMRAELNDAR